MSQDHCLYCGSSDIIPIDADDSPKQSLHILKCQNCKIMFTGLEQRFEADDTPADDESEQPGASHEETALDEAMDLIIEGRYNRALEVLSRHKYPLANPLPFILYRDVCQAAAALENIHILGADKDFDCLTAGASLLDLFGHNLRNIEYYMPDDEEERFFLMDSVNDAVLSLCSGFRVVIDSPLPRAQRQQLLDSVIQTRNTLMKDFAAYLETMQKGTYSSEYMDMAKDIRESLQMESEKKDMTITDRCSWQNKAWAFLFSRKGIFLSLLTVVICTAACICLCIHNPDLRQSAEQAFKALAMCVWTYVVLGVMLLTFCLKTAQEHKFQKDDRERRRIYSRLYGSR